MKVYHVMHAVMSEVGAIEKSRTNPQQGYKFRGIDEVLEALQPLFVKHGLICTQEVLHHEREVLPTKSGGSMVSVRLKVKHTYTCVEDGSQAFATTWGEAMDSGDKASNKAMAAALKYSHCFSFTIPTREAELDSETQSPEVEGRPLAPRLPGPVVAATHSSPAAMPQRKGGMPTNFPNYGKAKGAPIVGASSQDLAFYRAGAMRTLGDATKAQFHERERALLEAIDLEASRQSGGKSEAPF